MVRHDALSADLLLINGRVLTMDAHDSVAQAVAVRDGKIVAVGATGMVEANPHDFLTYRARIGAQSIKLIAEVNSRHFRWLGDQSGIEGALGVGVRGHGVRCQYSVMALMVGVHHAGPQTHVPPVATPPPGSASQATFTNPIAYCAALGTIDAPDSRYTGPKVPDVVAQGLKKAFGAPADAPLDPFLHHTFWRCMDGQVYACTVGANLPCQERADVSQRPTQGMTDFVKTSHIPR
jgi:hypothetical protein